MNETKQNNAEKLQAVYVAKQIILNIVFQLLKPSRIFFI